MTGVPRDVVIPSAAAIRTALSTGQSPALCALMQTDDPRLAYFHALALLRLSGGPESEKVRQNARRWLEARGLPVPFEDAS